MIGSVRFAINGQGAGAANSFTTIRIERNRFFAADRQTLVNDVQHLEKRRVRRNISRFVIEEFALGIAVLLSPDFELEVHYEVES